MNIEGLNPKLFTVRVDGKIQQVLPLNGSRDLCPTDLAGFARTLCTVIEENSQCLQVGRADLDKLLGKSDPTKDDEAGLTEELFKNGLRFNLGRTPMAAALMRIDNQGLLVLTDLPRIN